MKKLMFVALISLGLIFGIIGNSFAGGGMEIKPKPKNPKIGFSIWYDDQGRAIFGYSGNMNFICKIVNVIVNGEPVKDDLTQGSRGHVNSQNVDVSDTGTSYLAGSLPITAKGEYLIELKIFLPNGVKFFRKTFYVSLQDDLAFSFSDASTYYDGWDNYLQVKYKVSPLFGYVIPEGTTIYVRFGDREFRGEVTGNSSDGYYLNIQLRTQEDKQYYADNINHNAVSTGFSVMDSNGSFVITNDVWY